MTAKTISFTMTATPKAGHEKEFLTDIENLSSDAVQGCYLFILAANDDRASLRGEIIPGHHTSSNNELAACLERELDSTSGVEADVEVTMAE
jgi:hypothetical protein